MLLNHQVLLSQDFRLCEMTLQLKVMINFFILKMLISCCRHLRTVMSELVPARERRNYADQTLLNGLCSVEYDFNVNSCDCSQVNPVHGCIHGDHIATYLL